MIKKETMAYKTPDMEVSLLEMDSMLMQSPGFASEIEEVEIIDYEW